jgi:aminoglycoside 3-N-acetyltransferase
MRRIADDLSQVGVRPGGILLVHSSLSSMGHVPDGPETVIRGLQNALGPEGTLLLPALSYEHVGPHARLFDVRRTPSNVGAIPEHFRTRPGTQRSVCPTHSVCGVGARAAELLGEHHLDETPCGAHSPFRRLRDLSGQILFLGCGLRPNTSMHAIEELVEPPYLFSSMVEYDIILADGQPTRTRCRAHGFRGYGQRYDRIEPLLMAGSEIHTGRVLDATVHVLEAPALWNRALAALRRDPFHFVERIG